MVKFAGVALVMSLPVTLGVLVNTRAPQMTEVAVERPSSATESCIAAPGRVEGPRPRSN